MSNSIFRLCPRCGSVEVSVESGRSGLIYQVCKICGYRVAEKIPRIIQEGNSL